MKSVVKKNKKQLAFLFSELDAKVFFEKCYLIWDQ